MRMHTRWIQAPLTALLLCCETATAIAPFGPPRATIGSGRWTFGVDYSHQKIDMQSFGIYREGYVDDTTWYCKYNQFDLTELESNLIFGKIGYGLGDTWDLFARVGVSDAQGNLAVPSLASDGLPPTQFFMGDEQLSLDHGFGLACGVGSRMTFVETGDLALGTIVQMTWLQPGESQSSFTDTDLVGDPIAIDATIDLSYWEIQLALGATLNLGNLWAYGGPFVYFATGDLDIDGTWSDVATGSGSIRASHDVREESNFGAYGGFQVNLADTSCLYFEGLVTGDGWGVGVGGVWRLD